MTKEEYMEFLEQLKKKLQNLWDKKAFDPLFNLINDRFNNTDVGDEPFELYFYAVKTINGQTKKIIPLSFIGPSQIGKKYSGVHFGVDPKLPPDIELELKVIQREKK